MHRCHVSDVMHSSLLSTGATDWHKVIQVKFASSTMSGTKAYGWLDLALKH